ncbi:CTTNBP2 N-terminal-like protein isoform X2 [Syngnathoides biaculeatus]|uniref:CTTNBP2 N-terminal-like protein isoform X2 n=1 Tax=Syngnathoides biaculeatus TaxID=300417 RepID=UPI002ADD515E|nr:CTTNBP2 N-terminal-like protein isoform X2 [Syngnathoides biaculeatus]
MEGCSVPVGCFGNDVIVGFLSGAVIMDLEEEKRKHAEDTAEGDDVTYILEKERERLQQQLDFERSQVRRLEKEQRRAAEQLEEERAQHKQLSCALAKECKWASARALEEGHRLTEAGRKLDKEREACQALKEELEEERRRALRMEARVEEQLAEFDTEREQLRSRLRKEEAHCARLQQQVEELQRKLSVVSVVEDVQEDCEQWATKVPLGKKTAETKLEHNKEESRQATAETKVNGHHFATEADEGLIGGSPSGNPAGHQTLTSSPCASPLLTKRQIAPAVCKSSYQAGINQRFQAARHRFQATPPDLETAQALSPCTSPPPPAESSKQMARSTVTQVLSRFTTTQQAPNPSPFGTDYRCLTAPLSPVAARAAAAAAGPPQGVRSPTIPRADRGNPPPIPPKKPSLGQAPPSPAAVPRSGGHLNDGPRSGSCGLTSGQDAVKELDVVLSSN